MFFTTALVFLVIGLGLYCVYLSDKCDSCEKQIRVTKEEKANLKEAKYKLTRQNLELILENKRLKAENFNVKDEAKRLIEKEIKKSI